MTFALIASATSNASSGGGPLPAPLSCAPRGYLLASRGVLELVTADAGGNALRPVLVLSLLALIGLSFCYQWAAWDLTVNTVMAGGGIATVGH